MIMMLSDDDALVEDRARPLSRQSQSAMTRTFCSAKWPSTGIKVFQDPDRNSVTCPRFSGKSRIVSVDEFVGPVFAFRQRV